LKKKQKRWQPIKLVAIILLLFLPFYFWFLVNLSQIAIQIPREWKQFKAQETSLLNAIVRFSSKNQHYPENLTELPDEPILQSEKWSFRYDTDDNGEFILQADLPKFWFSWPTRRVCLSQADDAIACNFHYVCYFKQGVQWLSEPIQQGQPGRPLLGIGGISPCVSSNN
jgi:hypothetical protein